MPNKMVEYFKTILRKVILNASPLKKKTFKLSNVRQARGSKKGVSRCDYARLVQTMKVK